ncbi:efflux transporter periplasmic adaptor subunit [Bacillus sp. MYb56]|uniref:efflux RND transporter periplasmic adaptor subunit n=1 Tax=Bacillus sp. MYb56 TaxID=1827287 RepID=UPI000CFB158F|nr:efflux RND transporter periplasmic adaptor subunit [Bacillus sp. MYb56]PRD05642.1 efflux transporter periplasmic adaptor subunit [Bacillus sp. MYb56]
MLFSIVHIHKKKKKLIFIGVFILIIMIASISVFFMQGRENDKAKGNSVSFEKVTERKINNTKLISGQVKPGNIESFYSDSTKGKVKDIEVKEGQEIEKGTKLFSYDNEEINLQIKQADLDQKMADMRYDQGKKKIDSLKKEIKKVKDSGAGKEVTDPMDEQLSELEMQQKTIELEKEKGKLQKEELSKKKKDLTIYSKFEGVIQKLDKDAAQSSSQVLGGQGKAFLQVASKDAFEIQGTLTELQKSQIQKDQQFIVTAKANNKKKWTGKITEVSEFPTSSEMAQVAGMGEETRNMSQYTYKASIDSQDGLSPGYHVSLQVNLEDKTMIAIPSKSIVEKDNDILFVYIEEKGKIRKQNVKKGTTDGDWTEIVEGLIVGQKVVKNPSDNVYDGMEVKEK